MALFLLNLLQVLLIVALAPLATGLLRGFKGWLQNRSGPPFVQPMRDLHKLVSKEVVLAPGVSWLYRVAPYVIFTATVLAASTIPVIHFQTPLALTADVIALAGLLMVARLFLALAGMEGGGAFGGLGASREMNFSAFAEPAMLMALFVLSLHAQSTNLATMIDHLLNAPFALHPSIAFALAALLMVAVAENGRIPIDNPATHLELTMVHEAMILEYSGRHLALIEWAGQIRLLLFLTLIADLFMPWGIGQQLGDVALSLLAWLVKCALLLLALALLETGLAKMRIFEVPDFLNAAFVLALLGMLTYYMLEANLL